MIHQPYSEMRLEDYILSSAANVQQCWGIAATSNGKSVRVRQNSKRQCDTAILSFPITQSKMSTSRFTSSQQRWSAVVSRNPDAVGSFVYAVKTTKIYCKPDCKARLARQANVNFYDSGPLAEEAGFRACKRCKPELIASQQEDPLLGKIRHAVYLVEDSASRGIKISLGELSSEVGLSKWHLQRVFTKRKF